MDLLKDARCLWYLRYASVLVLEASLPNRFQALDTLPKSLRLRLFSTAPEPKSDRLTVSLANSIFLLIPLPKSDLLKSKFLKSFFILLILSIAFLYTLSYIFLSPALKELYAFLNRSSLSFFICSAVFTILPPVLPKSDFSHFFL